MSIKRGPTLRAQWLGKRLRELRESAGLTLKDAADYLQRDPATISRMEAGIVPARVADVMALLDLFSIDDEHLRAGLERLSREARYKGWWDGYDAELLGGMIDHAWIEARAEEIRSYDVMAVPGLLQTPEYAESTIRGVAPDAPSKDVERWVEFRMNRQRILTQDEPPRLAAILDESVLRRIVGGPEIIRAQLRRLAELTTHPSITIKVLPFRASANVSVQGPFMIFTMPDPYPDVAYVETRGGDIYVESPRVEDFARAYTYLDKAALTPEESAALIAAATEQIE